MVIIKSPTRFGRESPMADFDIHIRGGTIVDGTRVPRYRGDVWIRNGRIAQLGGRVPGSASKTIDADGLIVAPGFVDLHTHYDAQIRWDPWCTYSGWHGVTSVVLGNCGFGFAPVKPEYRERSMLMMTRNEAIPIETMRAGMIWDWETIPEYLDSLARVPKGVNCIQYLPTASLMVYVMGLEAAKSRPATEAERAEMRQLFDQGMDAGLCGFSIQRLGPNSPQPDFDGTPMVTDTMCDEDILNLARVLRERDEGIIQITQVINPKRDLAFQERLAEEARRPVLYNVIAADTKNPRIHRRSMEWIERCRSRGLEMFGQTFTMRSGFSFSLEGWNFWDGIPAWRAVMFGPVADRIARMKDPAWRERAIRESEEHRVREVYKANGGALHTLIVQWINDRPELERYVGRSIGDIAREETKQPVEVMIDLSIAGALKTEFRGPVPCSNSEHMAELITGSPYTIPGVSDGGAHMKYFLGGAYTTDFLQWLVRDEQRLTLEEAHYRLSALPAHAAGFRDRGTLREGGWADVVVYDLNHLGVEGELAGEIVHDLPGGEWRRVQRARGYRAIIVNGELTFENGKPTGATPGKLLRHGRG
jgi:N-acyl-D-amino-acid deacylase